MAFYKLPEVCCSQMSKTSLRAASPTRRTQAVAQGSSVSGWVSVPLTYCEAESHSGLLQKTKTCVLGPLTSAAAVGTITVWQTINGISTAPLRASSSSADALPGHDAA